MTQISRKSSRKTSVRGEPTLPISSGWTLFSLALTLTLFVWMIQEDGDEYIVVRSLQRYHDHPSNTKNSNNENNTVCVPWEETNNMDEWWTHHPEFEMGAENDTHYCFERIQEPRKLDLFRKLYQVQFHGDCSQTLTKRMWSSGWNADFRNVVDGLKHAVSKNYPVQIEETPWHYADPWGAKPDVYRRTQIRPVCSSGDMFCYFLPLSSCPAGKQGHEKQFLEKQFTGTKEYQWLYEYATRRQTWLRKAVYDFRKNQTIHGPCTAMHVRRGDVVLHPGDHKRKYHAIKEYMNETFHVQKNIFLMTDDANAITEAETEFPDYNWMYIERPRYKAHTGGFENQIPSNDPIHEVVVILTTFQLVRQCSQLIHSFSAFSTQLYSEMEASGNCEKVDRIKIDAGAAGVFDASNRQTIKISLAYGTATSDDGLHHQDGSTDE